MKHNASQKLNRRLAAALMAAGLMAAAPVFAADAFVSINDNHETGLGNANNDGAADRYGVAVGVAVGVDAKTTGLSALAVGTETVANGQASTAVGALSNATAKAATAVGEQAKATAEAASAIGRQAAASGNASTAVGSVAEASGKASSAFGTGAIASGSSATALGEGSEASGNNAIAAGQKAQASGKSSAAYGSDAVAEGDFATAVGPMASATGIGSVALGLNAAASETTAVAIGRGAVANERNSVALGAGSTTDAVEGTDQATVNNITYGGFAGSNPFATVSVGSAEYARTVTNVGAGRVTAESTDAINGSQLYATNNVIGNVAGSTKKVLGGNAAVDKDGNITMTNIGGTGKDNIDDAIKASKTQIAAGDNVVIGAPTTNADGQTVYTINAKGSETKAGSDAVTVTPATEGNNTTYTVDLAPTTKQTLGQVGTNTTNITNLQNQINQYGAGLESVNKRMDDMEDDLRAGIAGATAMAFLQRPNEAGKSLVSAAVGGYRDQQALAIGYARNSDNNKWSVKAGVGVNTQKDINWGGSVDYQW